MKGQANAYSHTHCQTAQANPQTQVWQRVCLSNRTTKMVLKNFPTLQKNKKTPGTTRQTNDTKPNNDNGLQTRWTRTPAANSGFAKVAVQCFV
jgi:hypothetical protein